MDRTSINSEKTLTETDTLENRQKILRYIIGYILMILIIGLGILIIFGWVYGIIVKK